jgi:hypothetical protein
MTFSARPAAWLLILIALSTARSIDAAAAESECPIRFKDGHWRVEASAMFGVHSGSTNREGDYVLSASIEYEMPAWKRATFGLKFIPVLLYHDDREDGDSQSVGAAAFGVTTRVYQKAESRCGFYIEGGVSVLGQTDKLEGNSSSVNFLSDFGVGYKWDGTGWHVVAKVQHISNGGLAEHNAGANAVGLGAGFTF